MGKNKFNNCLHITEENFLENFDKLMTIIKNSPEYQKLADCTQVIFDKKGNNKVHNRQTHTEMVAKLAGMLAERVGLSQYEQKLARLIGICHDLGHTAFGHTGESRIDKVLKYYGISAKEFNNAYALQSDIPELIISEEYVEAESSFEHHAHSRRVLRKILKENNIIVDREVLEDLEWGILCHSESRTKNEMVTKKLWTLARYADKFYAFTDIIDTMRSENYIPGDILHRIQEEEKLEEEKAKKTGETRKSYFADKNSKEDKKIELEENDFKGFSALLEVFDKSGISFFVKRYIEEAKIVEEDGYFYIDTETDIGRKMRIFQGVMKYMREKGFIGKEEKLANAMVDEIIAYRIAHPKEGITEQKDKVLSACLYVSMATDTELRDFYKYMSQDKEWVESFDKKMEHNVEFETEVDKDEREYIRNNPDMILNYYFDTEINKVRDKNVQDELFHQLIEYRTSPTLKGRRELIKKIEMAKSGGNPFSFER